LLTNKIRIIGGKWRGRKLTFPNIKNLRPTPNRIRETLFNWLAPAIHDAYCLDLFAGSGALGFEALSRGAKKITLVENNDLAYEQLQANVQLLKCKNAEIHCMQAEDYLQQTSLTFDIVFLDPPFHQNLVPKFCEILVERQLLKPNAYIYIETEVLPTPIKLPDSLEILKQKKAGKVMYSLAKCRL
jgi:16S rRNA (guanine966-N2)-methyltransferase